VSAVLAASFDEVVEQLVLQIWVYRSRGGDHAGARKRAQQVLKRLLARGLPSAQGSDGALRLDPYLVSNALKARAGESADAAWSAWLETARRNAVCLPPAPHRYRFNLRREWQLEAGPSGRPIVLRLPLPLRGAQRGIADVRLLEPDGALIERRDSSGRVELRLHPSAASGLIVTEMSVEFVAAEVREVVENNGDATASSVEEDLWLRPREGLIAPSPAITEFAESLPGGRHAPMELATAAFARLIAVLRLGDVHREHLDEVDPLGRLLRTQWSDCALGAALMVAVCRARGVPARIVSGYLLHPVAPAPHSWAEVRTAPGRWSPFDLGTWDYCAGDPRDPVWGSFFAGRVDARMVTEVAPHEFTGWGSARPPPRWLRQQRLRGDRVEHTLRALPSGALAQRDQLSVEALGPDPPSHGGPAL
jgi:Transglutaminase-like superfamily